MGFDTRTLMVEQARVFRRRHMIRNEIVPAVVALVAFWGWMFLFGLGTDWLENHTAYDPFGWLRGTLGEALALLVLMLTVGPIGAMAVAMLLGYALMIRRMRRLIAWYRETPACVHCDYDLSAVDANGDGLRRCPECGRMVLPLRARAHACRGVVAEAG